MSLITGLRDLYPHLGFDDRQLAASCDDGWLGILYAFLGDADKAMTAWRDICSPGCEGENGLSAHALCHGRRRN